MRNPHLYLIFSFNGDFQLFPQSVLITKPNPLHCPTLSEISSLFSCTTFLAKAVLCLYHIAVSSCLVSIDCLNHIPSDKPLMPKDLYLPPTALEAQFLTS